MIQYSNAATYWVGKELVMLGFALFMRVQGGLSLVKEHPFLGSAEERQKQNLHAVSCPHCSFFWVVGRMQGMTTQVLPHPALLRCRAQLW